MATESDRDTVYRLRHDVYGCELHQHAVNHAERLSDSLDRFNVYIVVCIHDEIAGFISVTPPGHESYSIDKYLDRNGLPFPIDDGVYEMRLLTVLPSYRTSRAAFLLMYAATVWIWAHGGVRIIAIGRNEVFEMYRRVGMRALGREIRSGAVTYQPA